MNSQNMWTKPWVASLCFHMAVLIALPFLPWPAIPRAEDMSQALEIDYVEIKQSNPKGNPNSGGDGGDGSGDFSANLPAVTPMTALPEYSEPLTATNENSIITKHQETTQKGVENAGLDSALNTGGGGPGSGGHAGFGSGTEPGIQGSPDGTDVDTTFYRPVPTYTPKPRYPRSAKNQNVRGSVGVGLTIGTDGSVESAWVNDSSGSDVLDQAAIDAVSTWRFEPARRGNEPISTTTSVNVEFQLR